jgi:hypothetical protein
MQGYAVACRDEAFTEARECFAETEGLAGRQGSRVAAR